MTTVKSQGQVLKYKKMIFQDLILVFTPNHLQFCMMASTVTWIYANRLGKISTRRHSVKGRTHYVFSDVRRLMSDLALLGMIGMAQATLTTIGTATYGGSDYNSNR